MDERQLSRVRIAITACVALAEWAFLGWQYTHGGVASHHFLGRADMPAISNGWGALVLPCMGWLLLGRVQRRVASQGATAGRPALIGLAGGLCYGVLLAVFFTLGRESVTGALFEALFVIAVFVPIHRAEYLLGFILGMAYTFGGVLPSVVGSVLALIALVIHRATRAALAGLRHLLARTPRRS
ncbi:hypothetical protein [Dyella sp.]|jgi:hypothetical protein|uniref:hypothetical protein n=1 Tax=Dyella sp. TaxID=1869338 RepID=UPI002D7655C6|nr:hypothetical protein [Dyella sp.]HET6433799.1 hypothetical protein [Dyella sp.]